MKTPKNDFAMNNFQEERSNFKIKIILILFCLHFKLEHECEQHMCDMWDWFVAEISEFYDSDEPRW